MILAKLGIVIATVIVMEFVAWWVHKYIMHSKFGWGWHQSHHVHTDGPFERNDLYSVVFSVISAVAFILGSLYWWPLWYVGLGFAVYGLLYYFVHDGLVHQRWPFNYTPKRGYLFRLVLAHRMHHHTTGRDGAVSFGFLYAENPDKLKAQLKAAHAEGRA